MEVTLTKSEVKHILQVLSDANQLYVKCGSRDFTWEKQHQTLVEKFERLKELWDIL